MEQLGAQPVVRRGDGDDDEDIDADFDTWRTELYTSLDSSSSLLDKKEVCSASWLHSVTQRSPSPHAHTELHADI